MPAPVAILLALLLLTGAYYAETLAQGLAGLVHVLRDLFKL